MKNGFLCHKCLKRIKYKFLHPMHHNKIKSVYITTAFAKHDRNSYQLWYHNYKSVRRLSVKSSNNSKTTRIWYRIEF